MKKTLFVMSILFAAACGGKSKGGGGDPCADPCKDKKMAAMTCDGMADNVAGAMTADGEMPADAVESMRGLFADQCTTNGWSQEAIDCMAAATNEEEGSACESNMTEEQKTAFGDAMTAAMEEMGGGGGGEEGME